MPFDKNGIERIYSLMARAFRERGFDCAKHREFPEAVADLNNALDLEKAHDPDKDAAQTCRICGLTCCLMARDCHDRRRSADEEQQWEAAIKYFRRAIWLDPDLEYELRRPLEDAKNHVNDYARPRRS